MRLRRDDDRGLTLIEVLVTVVLLTIIIVPLTNAVITYLRNTDAVNDRLAASHDAQIAAAYFSQDVQSIGVRDWAAAPYSTFKTSVEENVGPTTGANPCGLEGGRDALLRLAWDDPAVATGNPPKVVVSYVAVPRGSVFELQRWRCRAGALQDTAVITHNLESVPDPDCGAMACTDPAVPQTISMELRIRVEGSTNATLVVTLKGHRRQTS
jgi:prepilin-type N-terminal cleavage/methylation domain-containing protein